MKKFFAILLCVAALAASLCMTSCSKDQTTTQSIVGTWESDNYFQYYLFVDGGVCYTYDDFVSSENPPIKGTYSYDGTTLVANLGDYSLSGTVRFALPLMVLSSKSDVQTFTSVVAKYSQADLEKMLN